MKDKHTIKRSADERRKGKIDWKRVDALSEEEIEKAENSKYCTCGICVIELNRKANLLRYEIYSAFENFELACKV